MPLTAKGRKIKAAMTSQYGAKKGTSVFYASINKGKVTGAEKGGGKVMAKARTAGMSVSYGGAPGAAGGKVMSSSSHQGGGEVAGENRGHIGQGYEHAQKDTARAGSTHPMQHAKGAGSGRW